MVKRINIDNCLKMSDQDYSEQGVRYKKIRRHRGREKNKEEANVGRYNKQRRYSTVHDIRGLKGRGE